MTTASEEYLNRYKQVEKASDSLGRLFTVGRLRPSQQIRINEMTPNLEGDSEIVDNATGKTYQMPRRAMPLLAAAVRMIDEDHIPFPRTRGELDAIIDRIDEPGFVAILEASGRLAGGVVTKTDDEGKPKTVLEVAEK